MQLLLRGLGLVLMLVLFAAGALTIWGWAPDLPRERLIAEYGGGASQFVELPSGVTVHLRDQGCRDCEAVILVHGSNASLHTWEPWAEQLAPHWRVVTIDMPGHGLTGGTPDADYTIGRAAGVVEEVRAHLDLASAHVGGNSRGGAIALYYAVEHPGRVRSLALLNAAGAPWPQDDGEDEDDSPLIYRLAANPAIAPLLMNFLPRSLVADAVRGAVADPATVSEAMVERYHDVLRFPGNREATLIRQGLDYPMEPYRQAHTLDMPVLVMWGELDTVVPLSQLNRFVEAMPHARTVVYADVGHTPMEEIPVRSASDYADFLDAAEAQISGAAAADTGPAE